MLSNSTSPSTNLATTPPLPTAHCLDTSEVVARFPHLPARFTTSPLALLRLNELFLAKHGHGHEHAEAEAVLFQLDQLDKALGKVLVEEGLLFRGGSVSGEAMLAELTKD